MKKWQWTLRQQLAVVLVLCLVASFVGMFVRTRYLHAEFHRLGCEVLVVGDRPIGGTRQFGVQFQGAGFDDAALSRAMLISDSLGFSHETVCLAGTSLSETGLARLCAWRDIRIILVQRQGLTSSGIDRFLHQLPNLEHLEVDGRVIFSQNDRRRHSAAPPQHGRRTAPGHAR